MTHKIKLVLLSTLLISLFVPTITRGVSIASDEVRIYENGKRINDESIIWGG